MRSSWRLAAPLVVWLAVVVIPRPLGLSRNAWSYLGLFAAVVVALVLEPLPPAAVGLVGLTLATVLGFISAKPAEAIKWGLSGFSDGTVWLIFGALVVSLGYEKTGLGRRIALTLVKALGKSSLGLGYAVMLADLAIAPFTPSNTGRSAGVIYPIVRSIPALYGSAPGPSARRLGAYLMWTAFATTGVTSSMFLTALAPNLLAVSLIHQEIALDLTWAQWSMGVLPIGTPLLVTLPVLVYFIYPPEIRASEQVPAWAAAELVRMGPLSMPERVMGLLVLLAFCLWVFGGAWINATTAILAIVSLMVLCRVVDWDDITGNRAAWNTVVYFATLMTLADGLNRVGFITWAAQGVARLLVGASPVVALVGLVSFFFLVHYAFASLTAHTVVVLPALLAAGALFPGMPVKVFALLLAYSIGLMGVITPYATGPAPVYFGSGFIPRKDFWMLGFVFGLIYLAVLLGVGIPWLGTCLS
ncbi:MAG TPA: DASS family sodium-coupled anion symporter [Isosphaeraceae bacterium]|nr:DASS family sodium-coupled anion symporter [Isosphaeraceae bacterium]